VMEEIGFSQSDELLAGQELRHSVQPRHLLYAIALRTNRTRGAGSSVEFTFLFPDTGHWNGTNVWVSVRNTGREARGISKSGIAMYS